MSFIHHYIMSSPLVALAVLVAACFLLIKSASYFVDTAVGIATRLNIPKLVIGLILVSLATTTPELTVSLVASLRGSPEMALGNAVGSVICNAGLALGLAGLVAPAIIRIAPAVLRVSGAFLLFVTLLSGVFVLGDNTLSRREGGVLLLLFAGYLLLLIRLQKRHRPSDAELNEVLDGSRAPRTLPRMFTVFFLALLGIVFSSNLVVTSAISLSVTVGIPKSVVALTLVAVGTSIPEVATCIVAARHGHGEVAIGNILGANIMNICWVAGASALVNNLTISAREMYFMFPAMLIIVALMLVMLLRGNSLSHSKAWALLGSYGVYTLVLLYIWF